MVSIFCDWGVNWWYELAKRTWSHGKEQIATLTRTSHRGLLAQGVCSKWTELAMKTWKDGARGQSGSTRTAPDVLQMERKARGAGGEEAGGRCQLTEITLSLAV